MLLRSRTPILPKSSHSLLSNCTALVSPCVSSSLVTYTLPPSLPSLPPSVPPSLHPSLLYSAGRGCHQSCPQGLQTQTKGNWLTNVINNSRYCCVVLLLVLCCAATGEMLVSNNVNVISSFLCTPSYLRDNHSSVSLFPCYLHTVSNTNLHTRTHNGAKGEGGCTYLVTVLLYWLTVERQSAI